MRPSARLLHRASRITLFTRANCSLCDDAKLVLSRVWNKKPFEFEEIDVMAPAEKQWRDIYEFDTPVIHVQKTSAADGSPNVTTGVRKLMHRFGEGDVEELLRQSQSPTPPA